MNKAIFFGALLSASLALNAWLLLKPVASSPAFLGATSGQSQPGAKLEIVHEEKSSLRVEIAFGSDMAPQAADQLFSCSAVPHLSGLWQSPRHLVLDLPLQRLDSFAFLVAA